ncbi:MAG: hypothetical protein NE334_13950 [Lentisphaeraceae bacterium]|nr:hypothetical protein [Lentisphaeraceae bacterium]
MKYLLITLFIITQNSWTMDMLIIRGADGGESYISTFDKIEKLWIENAQKAKIKYQLFKSEDSKNDLTTALKDISKEELTPLWIVYFGHGTYIDRQAKLNLVGDDISLSELKSLFDSSQRKIIFINTASVSSPYITGLSKKNRIIISATKNASQVYYTKFNEFMPMALTDLEADMNKDKQTSLLEAFLTASNRTEQFYKSEKRLRGEDSLIDDNGDKIGTSIKHYDGLEPNEKLDAIDGFRAHQIYLIQSEEEAKISAQQKADRDILELEMHELKLKKKSLPEEEYYQKLEVILRKLSKIYKRQ